MTTQTELFIESLSERAQQLVETMREGDKMACYYAGTLTRVEAMAIADEQDATLIGESLTELKQGQRLIKTGTLPAQVQTAHLVGGEYRFLPLNRFAKVLRYFK